VSRGRHAARANFSRDFVIMILGIIVVGAVVFSALWFGSSIIGGGGEAADTPQTSVSTETTSLPATSTTVAPATTSTSAPPAETTTPTIIPREPSEIGVQVLNAVGTTGLAADVTTDLRAAGYRTVPPDDYEPILGRSQILFRDGYGPEAFELAALFPDAQVGMSRDMPDGVDLIILLGGSFEGG
jgi:hypothetical protein